MAEKNQDELIEIIWLRIEPCIKKLMPKANQIDLFRTQALVKRAIKHIVIRRDSNPLDMADKYLAAGEADYRAVNLLFQHKELALSTYHIQQAIEKAMKALCLSIGDVTIEQLRTTHRTPQPLLRIIEDSLGSEMKNILNSHSNRDYKTVMTQVKKLVNSDQQRLARLPMKSSARILGIDQLIKVADALITINPLLEQKEDEVKNVLAGCLPEYKESIVAYSYVKFGLAASQCYILGGLTFPHESYTRYPGGFLEPQDYTQEIGIVQAIPAITERIPRTLSLVWDITLICRKQIFQENANNA